MTRSARSLAAAAAMIAVAASGCGVGEGESDPGNASLTVTRDYGAEVLLEAVSEDPTASETVVRLLDREAEIETSYGDNFVDSIDGIAGRIERGRSEDWFFYVNGYWSPIGAGEARVRAGDRIWWDYRDWTEAYEVSAVVGSWPEPFLHGSEGERPQTEVVCFDVAEACAQVTERLREVGADVTEIEAGESGGNADGTLRVLVGSWERVRSDRVAAEFEDGPGTSGVYGNPFRCGDGFGLAILDDHGVRRTLLAEAAWVAALTGGGEQPTWVVSAGDPAQVPDAVELLDGAILANRYAVAATPDGSPVPLPSGAESVADSPEPGICE